jgi:hypothetical protein
MPNIVFASNNIAHFPLAVSGSEFGTFDPDRVPYAIKIEKWETLNGPKFKPVLGDNTWFHFRFYATTIDTTDGRSLISGYTDDGEMLFDVRKRANTNSMRAKAILYDGNTSITVDSDADWTFSKVNTCDVQITVKALSIELRLYINSALAATLVMGANPNGFTAPVRFSLGSAFNDALTNWTNVSEIIVADGDTRNARLDLLRPVAAGTYEQWNGLLGELADDDPTTGMTTIAGGQRQNVTLSPYSGASNISNFIITSQTTRGQNSPTALQHSIRLSGVDYDSAVLPLNFQLQYNMTDYNINPATSLPWVGSDLSLIETGFISVT